jgi:hypothetical protein
MHFISVSERRSATISNLTVPCTSSFPFAFEPMRRRNSGEVLSGHRSYATFDVEQKLVGQSGVNRQFPLAVLAWAHAE